MSLHEIIICVYSCCRCARLSILLIRENLESGVGFHAMLGNI